MAAEIATIYICPKCEEGITAKKRPQRCPGCGYQFRESDPMAPRLRMYPALSEQAIAVRDSAAYAKFLAELPPESALAVLMDACHIVEALPAKNCDVADISMLVGLAIRIGKMAEKYDDFLRSGGRHPYSVLHPPETRNQEKQRGDQEQSVDQPRKGAAVSIT